MTAYAQQKMGNKQKKNQWLDIAPAPSNSAGDYNETRAYIFLLRVPQYRNAFDISWLLMFSIMLSSDWRFIRILRINLFARAVIARAISLL